MFTYLYASQPLSSRSSRFQPYFAQLLHEFNYQYEVWVFEQDFGRTIGASVKNLLTQVVVKIYFQVGSRETHNPINVEVIKRVRDYLTSTAKEDFSMPYALCPMPQESK